MIILIITLVVLIVISVPAFIDGFTGKNKFAKYYGVKTDENPFENPKKALYANEHLKSVILEHVKQGNASLTVKMVREEYKVSRLEALKYVEEVLASAPNLPVPSSTYYSISNAQKQTISGEFDSVVLDCASKGSKLTAVKMVREKYGLSVKDAKDYVENLLATGKGISIARNANTLSKNVEFVDGMDGHQFEYFCADLLRNNGFSDVSVTRGSGDQGVDILAEKGGIRYAIQCKNYASPLSNTPVQEVSAGKTFYNCHVGVVLTNSTFTAGAISLAKATGVLLWDRSKLSELMEKATTISTPATQSTVTKAIPNTPTVPQFQTPPPHNPSSSIAKVKSYHKVSKEEIPPAQPTQKLFRVENIDIEIDTSSANNFGIIFDNFGIEMDEDDADSIEFLFDVIGRGGRMLPCDIDIVCNLYANNRKVATETDTIFRDSFRKKDSLCVYFNKKNICKTATKIEIFCKKW